jgi:hypothetical protein
MTPAKRQASQGLSDGEPFPSTRAARRVFSVSLDRLRARGNAVETAWTRSEAIVNRFEEMRRAVYLRID